MANLQFYNDENSMSRQFVATFSGAELTRLIGPGMVAEIADRVAQKIVEQIITAEGKTIFQAVDRGNVKQLIEERLAERIGVFLDKSLEGYASNPAETPRTDRS